MTAGPSCSGARCSPAVSCCCSCWRATAPGELSACFALASTSFIVALAHTTVANILLMQAGVPLVAALLSWALFREKIAAATWIAIGAVMAGVAIMVSGSITGEVSPVGDGLALVITVAFATATVITRRNAHVRMTPAVCLGMAISACVTATLAGTYLVSPGDFALLFAFGALNLGLGLAMFATGARLVPAAMGALVGTLEPILAPLWVWLIHSEIPARSTLIGGSVVFTALVVHILIDWRRRQDDSELSA
jgi:drug/metabolite transporter (DMT)-like permease